MMIRSLPALGLCAAVLSLAADQLLKSWAHAWVGLHGPVQAVPSLNIIATNNTGVAFSIGTGASLWVLVGIAGTISAWLFWWLFRARKSAEALGLGLAIGGALGNVVDRLRFGGVRDFIDLYWRDWHWPAFNFADVAIVSGLAVLILLPREPHATKIAPIGGMGRKLSNDRQN